MFESLFFNVILNLLTSVKSRTGNLVFNSVLALRMSPIGTDVKVFARVDLIILRYNKRKFDFKMRRVVTLLVFAQHVVLFDMKVVVDGRKTLNCLRSYNNNDVYL